MTAGSAVFLLILVLALGFFALYVQRLVRYLRLGFAENRTDHPFVRLRNVLEIGIAQKKIFRDPVAGPMHAFIFWGFMVLTAGTVEILIAGVFPRFSYELILPKPLFALYAASQDVFAVLVILAVGFAFYRRLVVHPRRRLPGCGAAGAGRSREAGVAPAGTAVRRDDDAGRGVHALRDLLLGARAPHPRIPQLPAVLEAPARHHVAHQRLLLEHERAGAEGRDAQHGPRGRRRALRRARRRAPLVEEPARRLLVHGVRPVHRRLSGQHHRQAAEPAQDRRQHAATTDGEGARRHGRSDGLHALGTRAR